MDLLYKRSFYDALLGQEIRGTIKGDGVSTFSTIFRIRRGNGHQGSKIGERYQDKYNYFIPTSINNPQGQAARDALTTAVSNWKNVLTAAEKAKYNKIATRRGGLTGFNLYVGEYIKANA